jgi:hypothetical protein
MNTFVIYPKKGEPFKTEMHHFEFSKTEFVLYDDYREPSKDGFLAFRNVAAIVRESLLGHTEPPGAYQARVYFDVYLKEREKPITICADSLDFSDPPSLMFYARQWANAERFLLDGIYIALDDVVAVLPSDGLRASLSR